jgi:hypothetical protein
MLIYERMKKPASAGLVEIAMNRGRLWISSLDATPRAPAFVEFWTEMWRRLGVRLVETAPGEWIVSGGSEWRYTTSAVPEGWNAGGFDDRGWRSGKSGFGTHVPNAQAATVWNTADIYLRREFEIKKVPAAITLEVYHDEDVTIWVNGQEVARERGFVTSYRNWTLSGDAMKAFRAGKNVVAVHCHQTAGGQLIDVRIREGRRPGTEASRPHDLLLDGPAEEPKKARP